MAKRRADSSPAGVSTEPSIVALARKLIGLAEEQSDALRRGATTQFDWLVLRRAEVMAELQRIGANGAVPPNDQRRELIALEHTLADLDTSMAEWVRTRMREVGDASNKVRRFSRLISPYLTAGPRVPSYVDKTN